MNYINIHQAKTHLSHIIKQVCEEEKEVIIAKAGNPMVVLSPFKKNKTARKPGALKSKITLHEDFDELPDAFMSFFT